MIANKEIYDLMKSHGLSQIELCKIAHIGHGTVYQWFHAGCLPKPEKLQNIAEYFGIPVAEIDTRAKAKRYEEIYGKPPVLEPVLRDVRAAAVGIARESIGTLKYVIRIGDTILIRQTVNTKSGASNEYFYQHWKVTQIHRHFVLLNRTVEGGLDGVKHTLKETCMYKDLLLGSSEYKMGKELKSRFDAFPF